MAGTGRHNWRAQAQCRVDSKRGSRSATSPAERGAAAARPRDARNGRPLLAKGGAAAGCVQDHETIRAQEALENFRIPRSHRSVCSLVCLAACLVYNGPVGPGSGTFDQNMASAGAGPGRRWGIDGPDRLCQLLRSACIANEDSNRDRSPVSTCGCRGFFGAVRARVASVDEGQGALHSTRVGTDNGRGVPRR